MELSNALALAGQIVHPGEMLTGTFLRPGSEMMTGTGGAAPSIWHQLDRRRRRSRAVGRDSPRRGPCSRRSRRDVRPAAGRNIGALAESEVALQIELNGGDATSDISSLDLPEEVTGALLFVVAMTGVRQCLVDFGVGNLILDSGIEAAQQDIAILFFKPNQWWQLALSPPFSQGSCARARRTGFRARCAGSCRWTFWAIRYRRSHHVGPCGEPADRRQVHVPQTW